MDGSDPLAVFADAVHEAAFEPELWPSALARLAGAFGGASVLLAAVTRGGAFRRFGAVGLDPAVLDRFGARHGPAESNAFHRRLIAMQPGEILTRYDVVPDDRAWRADPMYRDFLRPERIWGGQLALLAKDADGFAAAGVFLPRDFEGREAALFHACAAHLRRAVRVACHLGTLQARLDAAADALDRLPLGVLLADEAARVLHANAAARAMLAEADGLGLGRGGVLLGARPAETAALARLVAGAAAAARRGHGAAPAGERGAEGGGATVVPRPSGRRPLSVLVAPLRDAAASLRGAPPGASAVLFVSDPERRHEPPAELIRRLHGLTAAEAELVAHLLAGRALKDAADAMGVTANTAKTLLQRGFERTGTNRQAELIGLVLRGPAGLLPPRSPAPSRPWTRHPNG